jgi:hypothetical protein
MAVAAVGQVVSSVGASSQQKFQSEQAKSNAVLARRSADDSRQRGEVAEIQAQRELNLKIGAQRATAAANGVVVDQGSALDLTVDAAKFGKLDQLQIRNNAEREALGFEARAAQFDAEADNLQRASRNTLIGGLLSVPGAAIGAGQATQGFLGGLPSRGLTPPAPSAKTFTGNRGLTAASGV